MDNSGEDIFLEGSDTSDDEQENEVVTIVEAHVPFGPFGTTGESDEAGDVNENNDTGPTETNPETVRQNPVFSALLDVLNNPLPGTTPQLRVSGPPSYIGRRLPPMRRMPYSLLDSRLQLLNRIITRSTHLGGMTNMLQTNPVAQILQQSMEDTGGTKKVASDAFLETLSGYTEVEDTSEDSECQVCMDDYTETKAIELECGHRFHK